MTWIDIYGRGYDMLEYAKRVIKHCKKVSTQPYLGWLVSFMNTDEYLEPVNQFIALNKLFKDESDRDKRIELLAQIRDFEIRNKNKIK